MSTFFSKFKNKSVPIIGWKFVSTLKEGKGLYNQNTWSGWDNEWTPIATTEVGDVVVIKESCIYEITHGLGESPKPVLITKDIESLESFIKTLLKYKGHSKEDSIEKLREIKQTLMDLKKEAPRELKFNFTSVINDVKEIMSDKRWLKTKEGKFYLAIMEFIKQVYPELRKNGRFEEVIIYRNFEKQTFSVGGMLKEGESEEEVKEIISKYESPYPIEYAEFKPFSEENAKDIWG